jgi:hypothetical protein
MVTFIAFVVGALTVLIAPNPDVTGDGVADQVRFKQEGVYIESVCTPADAVGETTAE